MKITIILHNLVIDVEGEVSGKCFGATYTNIQKKKDSKVHDKKLDIGQDENEGEVKCKQLIAELLAYHAQCQSIA